MRLAAYAILFLTPLAVHLVRGGSATESFAGLLLGASLISLAGKLDQVRLNQRHRSLFGMDLSREEAGIISAVLLTIFVANSGEELPAARLFRIAMWVVIPTAFLFQGIAFAEPRARAIARRSLAILAVGAIAAATCSALGGVAWVGWTFGPVSIALSTFFIVRGGVRQLRGNLRRVAHGESVAGQLPRMSTTLIKNALEAAAGVAWLGASEHGALSACVLVGIPTLAAVGNAVNLLALAAGGRRAPREELPGRTQTLAEACAPA